MKYLGTILCLLMLGGISGEKLLAMETTAGWPKRIEKEGVEIVIYQPQVESLSANKLESRAAISVKTAESGAPVFGAMWFDCNIATDRDERTVQLIDLDVSAAKFPDVEEDKIKALSSLLEEEIPKWELLMSLDQLLADLDASEAGAGPGSEGLNNAPPEIIFTTTPSVLIMVDGDPIFEEIEGSDYERVLNSPYFIVRDRKRGTYYINGGANWYTSENASDWKHTTRVPKKLKQIAEEALDTGEDGYASEEAMQDAGSDNPVIPELILRTSPAELLQSDGEPNFSPVEGTSILYMSNTADDILMDIDSQEYYILVSGRWYRSSSLESGPWTFVDPTDVPGGFATIPEDSDVASVRASIAGTQEAKEAVLENQIPQTAEVDRSEASLEVSYDGKPKFEPVGKTSMMYAVNTDKSVLLIDGRYYCCDDAIWFESESANGPWIVSTVVPDRVQDIPAESPVYNVKYVYIYDSTPEVVYVGYTPGYVNSYVYRGCVYYGTGWYYRPWYGRYYYPRPVTYGFNVHWNPYSGWGFSYSVSYGWMTIGWGAPRYGWWGPAGYRHGYHYGYHRGYNRGYRAGYYAGRHASSRPTHYSSSHRASNNVYRNRGQGVSRTGSTYLDPKTGASRPPSRESRPTARPTTRDNNVYTDRNGNVYRREGDNWNRVDNASRPSTREGQTTRPSQPSRDGQTTTRPSQPSRDNPTTRPSTPSRDNQPATRPNQPSTRPSQPSTRPTTPSTRPSTPSTRPSQPATRPSTPNQNLNRDYQNRNRGAERSQQYNQNRNQYQYNRPNSNRSASPSRSSGRSAPSRSGSGRRR